MVEKKKKLSTKKGLFSPNINIRLTKNENYVLDLFTKKFLTINQIASIKGVTDKAIYKTLDSLRKKGVLRKIGKKVENFESTPDKNRFRLHGQEWNIKIISKSNKYELSRKKGNTIFLENNTLRLYENSIEIYGKQSFWGKNEQEATSISLIYWERFFVQLENRYGILLIKSGKSNIRLVNQHFSEINNEIAEDYLKRKKKLDIISKKDGKIWFKLDNSFGLKERECIHPETSKQDSEKVSKQINDWRKHDPPTNSQLAIHVYNVTSNQKLYSDNIESHIKAIQDLGKGVTQLVSLIKKMKEERE